MSKRYYWLKLNESFFEDDTIEWIEEQEGGEKYVLFYLKLCLKSLKEEGTLIRYVGERLIPYDIKALAKLTNTDKDTVAVAMRLFAEIGLISQLDSGEIFMNQINEMIGSETDSARKMRKVRARENTLEEGKQAIPSQCDHNVQECDCDVMECDTEIEIDIEKELELEIKKEIDKEKDYVDANTSTPYSQAPKQLPVPTTKIPYNDIVNLYNAICGNTLPKVQAISDKRKKTIKMIWKFVKEDITILESIFAKAVESEFLSGRNGKWTSCSFDWLVKQNNAIKVLEGNYDNKGTGPSGATIEQQMKSKGVQDFLNS